MSRRRGRGCGCCVPAVTGCYLPVELTDSCTSATLTSGTVTLNSGGSPIGTASITVGTLLAITLGAGGSGYSSGWHYLAFTGGGGTGAAGEFHVSSTGHVDSVALTSGGSGYTSAPTVSFPGAGGTGATATATAGTAATFAGVPTGSYTIDATSTGYNSITGTPETIAACPSTPIQIQMVPSTATLTFNEGSACTANPLSGIVVTVTQTGFSSTCTTDATGHCSISGVPTQVSTTVTSSLPPRFADGSRVYSSGFNCDSNASADLTVASGYVCLGSFPTALCDYPVKTTLQLNDSYLGVTTPITFNSGTQTWDGSNTIAIPACAGAGCPASTATITYSYNPSSNTVTITSTSAPAPNSSCPGTGGTVTLSGQANQTSFTCPPSLTITFTNVTSSGTINPLYCAIAGGPSTTTLTITE